MKLTRPEQKQRDEPVKPGRQALILSLIVVIGLACCLSAGYLFLKVLDHGP